MVIISSEKNMKMRTHTTSLLITTLANEDKQTISKSIRIVVSSITINFALMGKDATLDTRLGLLTRSTGTFTRLTTLLSG